MRIVILGLLLLFTAMARLHAAQYYIDYAGGSDSNAGTNRNAPWKHCPGDPAATNFAGTFSLQPGDTVNFKGGVTYVFSGLAGIRLNWDGVQGSPIIYNGNSDGAWGSGRAIFTDHNGLLAITAFSSASLRRHLSFRSLEIVSIGGLNLLPLDILGIPLSPQFGGGIAFNGGAEGVAIDGCVFRELGLWFNRKPLSAASLAGTAIVAKGANGLTISNCEFSRMATGCDFSASASFSNVQINQCTFGDSIVWPVNLPAGAGSSVNSWLSVSATSVLDDGFFSPGSWTGYGSDPRTDVTTVAAGATITFGASSVSSPSPSFQWLKNGVNIPGANGPTLQLSSVTAAHAGTYSVVATNPGGSLTSNSAILNVTGEPPTQPPGQGVAPVITAQPFSQVAAVSSTVIFSVAATGSPSPAFQWRKDGAAMAGATSSRLVLVGVNNIDSATYNVLVSNSAGSVLSNTVTLMVQTLPVIAIQPVSQTASALGSVTFSVVATGTPPPSFQWHKDGSPVAGATTALLSLANVTPSEAGSYAVVIANAVGSVTSNAATLTVSGALPQSTPPVITQQPVAQSIPIFGSASFTVIASGTPAPSYQWWKDGVALSGANSPTLTLTGVTNFDGGSYSVLVTNVAGNASSNAVTLTVLTLPIIAVQPASQTVSASSPVTFGVMATGTPAPTFQWRKNGVPLTGATTATLSWASASENDAGAYSVVVTNLIGSITSSVATLTVNPSAPQSAPPVITEQPSSQSVVLFDPTTFRVTATGVPAPSFQWSKDGVAIQGATSSSLAFPAVTHFDNGSYAVMVSNAAGSQASGSARLTVLSAPVIAVQPVSRTVAAGSSVNLSVIAIGSPAPAYQWWKDGVPVAGQTTSTLTLVNVPASAAGTYAVIATNSVASVASSHAILEVIEAAPVTSPPVITQQPLDQAVAVFGNATFTVAGVGAPAPSYQWSKNGVAISGATSPSLTLTGVTPIDEASYAVMVSNTAGSVASNSVTLTVLSAPIIAVQPVSRTVTAGSTALFSVIATGTPAPSFQWWKDGLALPGATNATLTLGNTTAQNEGTYAVIASNQVGSVASSGATLTVNGVAPPTNSAPVITLQPVQQSVGMFGTATFTVAATGTPAPTYQWWKDGVAIAGATSPTLTLSGVTNFDTAVYAVLVSNAAGSTQSNAVMLTVLSAPVIAVQPLSQSVLATTSVTFAVIATGTPPPSFQWSRNGVPLAGATSATLTLPAVTTGQAGTYTVVASNSVGAVTSAPASLVVSGTGGR